MDMPDKIRQLAELIRNSAGTVFFGGAGVSTESGIPDFRSESGLYSAQRVYGHSPEELLSHAVFEHEPALFFRYYKENLIYTDAKPNAAHIALARFERQGLLQAIITQNIDGLHQAAGSRNVLELHGSNLRHYCVRCNAKYPLEYIMDSANCDGGGIPICAKCGGLAVPLRGNCIVRPDVVLYGENLDDAVVHAAIHAIAGAELLIVGGTSLAVYPAAGLLQYFRGGTLVLINKTATPYDSAAQLVIRGAIGEVMAQTGAILT